MITPTAFAVSDSQLMTVACATRSGARSPRRGPTYAEWAPGDDPGPGHGWRFATQVGPNVVNNGPLTGGPSIPPTEPTTPGPTIPTVPAAHPTA
jgi:hypothetical protein